MNHIPLPGQFLKQISLITLIVLLLVSSICYTQTSKIVLTAVGDILLARLPGKRLLAAKDDIFPFIHVRKYFLASDIAFANLECPISERGTPYPGKPENVTFRAPLKALTALGNSGLSILSLANNHCNDFGPLALIDTMQSLEQMGIKYCGAGRYLEAAAKPAFITAKGIRFAFLGYAEPVWSTRLAKPLKAYYVLTQKERSLNASSADAPPAALPSDFTGISDLSGAVADIKKIKHLNPGCIIVVSIHWGVEHEHYPRDYQVKLAHELVNAGATIILGHHPHVLQSIEIYKNSVIIYSMGNFVFDMASDATYESALFQFHFRGSCLDSLSIIPIYISKKDYAPAPADEITGKRILQNLQTYSQKFGTALMITGNQGIITFDKKQ